ncbi:MAG TPA: archaellar assembly protein FlaJ [Methanoregulaceae archaeon]|nr:archaellar assembly protein FlaJ [Methanoregulaceae archaeon]
MELKNLPAGTPTKQASKIPFQGMFSSVKEKLSSLLESKNMASDMLFMMTYMASITTAQATRPEIFAYTSMRTEYVPAKYISKVEFFVKRWNYSYVEALTAVAERSNNEILRSMLNRYSNSIESGVPDEDFLNREIATIRSVYRNTYEQGLEMLKKWGDAYIAMLFSGALVGIIIMVSIAIFSPDNIQSTLMMSYMIVISTSTFGIITMFRSVPSDAKVHGLPRGSKEQQIIKRLELKIVIATVVIGVVFFGLSALGLIADVYGLVMLIIGLMLLPLGIIGYLDDSNIIKRDEDFTTFVRSLGAIMGGKGITIGHALAEIDSKSLVQLEPLVNSVYSKLNLGLDEKQSWEKFIGESGSNLIYKYLNIFRDSCELGGAPDKIGAIVGSSMLEQVLLREKRNTVSMGFVVLLIPMHAMMVAIFLFLFHILLTMSKAISTVMSQVGTMGEGLSQAQSIGGSMASSINMFVNFPADQMTTYIVVMITIITVANIIAGKIMIGGGRYMFYFFASILSALTGIVYILAPYIVNMFFNIPVYSGV